MAALVTSISGMTADTTGVFAYAGIAVVGLMAMWGLRKIVKFMNRS